MSQEVLRIGFYGVAFPQQAMLLAQPLITGLLAAGVEVTLVEPPSVLNELRHPGLRRTSLRSAHRLVDVLYVGQARLVEAARAINLPIVLDLSAHLFNSVLPTVDGYLTPVENPAWPQAQLARPVMTLRELPRAVIAAGAPLRIVSVMPMEWESGLEFAIDAVAEAIRMGAPVRYTIVGAGDYEDALIYGARLWDLWQSGHIQFQPSERAAVALAEADVLLHAPYIGRFEPVIIEALGRGLPIIVSDALPLPQIVGAAAFTVARRQPDELRDIILRVVAHPIELRQLAAASLIQAATWDNTDVLGWIAAFRQSLATRAVAGI